jgi:hypothetical protein
LDQEWWFAHVQLAANHLLDPEEEGTTIPQKSVKITLFTRSNTPEELGSSYLEAVTSNLFALLAFRVIIQYSRINICTALTF